MNKPLSEHPLGKPFKQYLYLAGCNVSDFYNQIQAKNSSISEPLSVLSGFKAYDILLPLNILIKVSFDTDILVWWNTTLAKTDCYNEIPGLTEKLYQKLTTPERRIVWEGYSDYEYFKYAYSIAEIEGFVWETCFEYFEDIYQNDAAFGICLFTPGLYASKPEYDFWKTIDERVFPELFNESRTISEAVIPNHFQAALVKRTVHTFCSELGIFYYTATGNMARIVLSYEKEQFEKLCGKDLTRMLEAAVTETHSADFYFSHNLVSQLEILYRYCKKYQFESFSCECLNLCIPVLLQCDGQYENAAMKALSYIRNMPENYKADERILLSMYIAMFTASSDIQSRIGAVLKELFNGEYQLNQIIDVLNDIKAFYIKFSKELSMRFDKNGIQQLKKSNPSFYGIYEIFISDILQGRQTYIDDIDNAYLLFKNLFANEKIVFKMDELIQSISSKNLGYSERLLFISYFYMLFSALTSHLETEVRICINDVLKFVSLPESDETKRLSRNRELFYIYTPVQVDELIQLKQRLSDAYQNLPDFTAVMKYETNAALFIKERLMDSHKQLVGFDSTKAFII